MEHASAQMSGGKDAMFARIREALTNPAPFPGEHGKGAIEHGEPPKNFGDWLPLVEDNVDAQIAAFAKCSTELKTEFHVLENAAELPQKLAAFAQESGWSRIATHRGELSDHAVSRSNLPTLLTDPGYDKHELEKCDVGISECDALVAQTGSVLITSRSAGGRALSVLPPHHVVIASRAQLVSDLPAAYRLLHERYAAQWPSFMSFITGPSRTGDIERILVLGAHGPKRLTIFLC